MLKAFTRYLSDKQLLPPDARCLLAVSGGVDSVVLAHLFHQAALPFGIAHCNFQLRGEASDEDERFVRQIAIRYQVPYHSTTFDTEQVAIQNKQSIQLAARELRYEWLEHLREAEGFHCIATAHHLNDSTETLLYNLTKGCGVRGLHGIPERNGHLIRPLLFAPRADIEAYLQAEQLSYREDASNASDKYSRNKIRHQVIPALKEINTGLEATMAANIARFKDLEALYHFAVRQLTASLVEEKDGKLCIDFMTLRQRIAPATLLYELLRPFQFNGDQVKNILSGKADSGQQYFSPTHRLLVNRHQLLIEPMAAEASALSYSIAGPDFQVELGDGRRLEGEKLGIIPSSFPLSSNIALLDFATLRFPLRLRRWRAGDRFQPLGMSGQHQKLQDFFTNKKLSLLDKERVWVLTSEEDICWVVGHRIDERFKLKPTSKACMKMELSL